MRNTRYDLQNKNITFNAIYKYDLFDLGMVYRSEGVIQWNLGLQYVFGAALLIPVSVHNFVVHVVHRTVFLSHRFRHGSGTERDRRLHHYQHHRSHEHGRNGAYTQKAT